MILQLQEVMEDNADHDWSFVPKQVLDHRISNTPRLKLVADKENPGKNKLVLDHSSHMRVQVCWANSEVSWISADALQT